MGKGWFSIHETNPDTYRQARRFPEGGFVGQVGHLMIIGQEVTLDSRGSARCERKRKELSQGKMRKLLAVIRFIMQALAMEYISCRATCGHVSRKLADPSTCPKPSQSTSSDQVSLCLFICLFAIDLDMRSSVGIQSLCNVHTGNC